MIKKDKIIKLTRMAEKDYDCFHLLSEIIPKIQKELEMERLDWINKPTMIEDIPEVRKKSQGVVDFLDYLKQKYAKKQ